MLAAGRVAEMPAQAEERLQLLLQQMPPGFIEWPRAAITAWSCLSAAEWNEKGPAIINAFNKAKEAGALQSTAERAAAAIAMHTIDGFREWEVDQKRRILERRVATKKMKAFACEARVLLKKARRLELDLERCLGIGSLQLNSRRTFSARSNVWTLAFTTS